MLIRCVRRLIEAWGYLGLPNDEGRVGPILAWRLAAIRWPSPAQERANRAMVREAIDWAEGERARRGRSSEHMGG